MPWKSSLKICRVSLMDYFNSYQGTLYYNVYLIYTIRHNSPNIYHLVLNVFFDYAQRVMHIFVHRDY